MSLAPDWSVPPDVSPFVPLPLLERCSECRCPLSPFEVWTVRVSETCVRTGLCAGCAEGLRHAGVSGSADNVGAVS